MDVVIIFIYLQRVKTRILLITLAFFNPLETAVVMIISIHKFMQSEVSNFQSFTPLFCVICRERITNLFPWSFQVVTRSIIVAISVPSFVDLSQSVIPGCEILCSNNLSNAIRSS